jgi:hypothetical protein
MICNFSSSSIGNQNPNCSLTITSTQKHMKISISRRVLINSPPVPLFTPLLWWRAIGLNAKFRTSVKVAEKERRQRRFKNALTTRQNGASKHMPCRHEISTSPALIAQANSAAPQPAWPPPRPPRRPSLVHGPYSWHSWDSPLHMAHTSSSPHITLLLPLLLFTEAMRGAVLMRLERDVVVSLPPTWLAR